jgi:AcrR family transcriptional regulator
VILMGTKQLRADAARKRQALVAAAREVMSERGLNAPLDEIARRAGVGNATLYRRFPRRMDLIVAVFADRMADHAREVDESLADPDPWHGLVRYITTATTLQVWDRGIADLVTLEVSSAPATEKLRTQAIRGLETLIARAKAAGAIRRDCTTEDVLIVLHANAGLIERSNRAAAAASQRLAHLLLDGLRADAATPGPPPPSARRMRAAMRERSLDLGFGMTPHNH